MANINYKTYGMQKINDKGKLWGEIYFFEKYDGSQLSFLIEGQNVILLNKGNIQQPTNRLYKDAYLWFVNMYLSEILSQIGDGYIFHGEALIMKYRSNTITYGSVPKGSFVCFGIQDKTTKKWLHPLEAMSITSKVGMTFAHLIWTSTNPENYNSLNFETDQPTTTFPSDPHAFAKMLTDNKHGHLMSSLGNEAEGIVVQSWVEGKLKFKKYPTPLFVELNHHKKNKINDQLTIASLIEYVGLSFATFARYQKGYQKYLIKYDCTQMINSQELSDIIWEDICSEQIGFIKDILYEKIKTMPATEIDLYRETGITSNLEMHEVASGDILFNAFEGEIRKWALSKLEEWIGTLSPFQN